MLNEYIREEKERANERRACDGGIDYLVAWINGSGYTKQCTIKRISIAKRRNEDRGKGIENMGKGTMNVHRFGPYERNGEDKYENNGCDRGRREGGGKGVGGGGRRV